jgi:hypothetical protein
MQNERGLNWRINRVEKSSFYLNSDIESLITNVEQVRLDLYSATPNQFSNFRQSLMN